MCLLSDDIYDYNFVSQGKTTIPNVDDHEECALTDVSLKHANNTNVDILVLIVLVVYMSS